MKKLLLSDELIICFECKKQFKLITGKHLATHNLSREEYCNKYNLAGSSELASHSLRLRAQKAGIKRSKSRKFNNIKDNPMRMSDKCARRYIKRSSVSKTQSDTLKKWWSLLSKEERKKIASERAIKRWKNFRANGKYKLMVNNLNKNHSAWLAQRTS